MKNKKFASQKGQGIVEYVLITALVALAAITIFRTFRSNIGTAYQKAGEALIQGVEGSIDPGEGSGE